MQASFTTVVTAPALGKLDESIGEFSSTAAAQNQHTRDLKGSYALGAVHRAALIRDHMRPIAKRELATSADLVKLTLPQKKVSCEHLGVLAHGMAAAARSHAYIFIDAGGRPDFIERLLNAANQMRSASHDSGRCLTQTELGDAVSEALEAMKTRTLEGFGPRLMALRQSRGLTQAELGKAARISQRMIAYYELESAQPPGALLVDLAKGLRVSADELLGLTPVREIMRPKTARLLKRLQRIEELPPADQRAVLKLVDAMLDTRRRSTPHSRAKRKAS